MEEILHQLKTVAFPIIYRLSRCFNHSFGGAGFRNHPQYHNRRKFRSQTSEVKLPTIWTDEKQSKEEAEKRERLEERRSEEKESEDRRCRRAKR